MELIFSQRVIVVAAIEVTALPPRLLRAFRHVVVRGIVGVVVNLKALTEVSGGAPGESRRRGGP